MDGGLAILHPFNSVSVILDMHCKRNDDHILVMSLTPLDLFYCFTSTVNCYCHVGTANLP